MLKSIPSWSIGAFGASLVIVATLISHLAIRSLNDEVIKLDGKIREINLSVDRLWDSHKLADNRKFSVNLFMTQLSSSDKNREIMLSNIAYYMKGSVLAMYSATDLNIPKNEHREIDLLRRGDLNAYKKLEELLESLREKSKDAINKRKIQKDALIAEKQKLEHKERSVNFWFMFLNILGLIVVLLKDLPIWKSTRNV
ncbi:MAG: hypothetical protein F4142_02265 [Nitrospira sp. SB0675_bin_23]|nr:hypothetical protein [Nitrospira sp. SB0661_bin_20]MYH01414.1 hypothetical protein [Nitrospira sp. SB0675_bin_23]